MPFALEKKSTLKCQFLSYLRIFSERPFSSMSWKQLQAVYDVYLIGIKLSETARMWPQGDATHKPVPLNLFHRFLIISEIFFLLVISVFIC